MVKDWFGLAVPSIALAVMMGCKGYVTESSDPPDADSGDEIVHGQKVPSSEELGKSVVALVSQLPDGEAICTGSILDSETILTAAHCLDDGVEGMLIVFGPKTKGVSPGLTRNADAFIQNPHWKKPSTHGRGDMALVHFIGGLPKGFVPVQLASSDTALEPGMTVVMLGYGVSNGARHSGVGRLREATTTIGDASKSEVVTDGEVGNICFGDSGGPAFVEENGVLVQWGVATAGSSYTCKGEAMHTSVLPYAGWIRAASGRLKMKTRTRTRK